MSIRCVIGTQIQLSLDNDNVHTIGLHIHTSTSKNTNKVKTYKQVFSSLDTVTYDGYVYTGIISNIIEIPEPYDIKQFNNLIEQEFNKLKEDKRYESLKSTDQFIIRYLPWYLSPGYSTCQPSDPSDV
jgi:hypothetical protein